MTASKESPPRWRSAIPYVGVAVLVICYVLLLTISDYLSSWLPPVFGFPAGAIARDGFGIVIVVVAIVGARRSPAIGGMPRSYLSRASVASGAGFVLLVALLVAFSDQRVAALLAARNLTLYFSVGFAVLVLLRTGAVSGALLAVVLGSFAAVAACLGILDSVTRGQLVSLLGYDRQYAHVVGIGIVAGVDGTVVGMVRASGGISNALVFGYAMAVVAVAATWFGSRPRHDQRYGPTPAWIALASLTATAALASLTRGALLAMILGFLLLIALERRRTPLFAISLVMAVALVASTGISMVGSVRPLDAPGVSDPRTPPIVGRFDPNEEVSTESSTERVEQLQRGLTALTQMPLGTGLASVGSASLRISPERPPVTDIYWVMLALQTGLPGLALFVLAAGGSVAWAHRRLSFAGTAVMAVTSVILVSGWLSASMDAPYFAGVASLVIALILSVEMRPTALART